MKGDDNLNEHIESLMQEKEHYEEKIKKGAGRLHKRYSFGRRIYGYSR